MTDLSADVDQYLRAALLNEAPPPIESDPLVTGTTPIEELLAILGLAVNADDPEDAAEGLDDHARRDAKTTEAATKFAGQDQAGVAQLAQVASSVASAVTGAVGGVVGGVAGGVLQPLAQFPQQVGQALQSGLGLFGGLDAAALGRDPLANVDDFGSAGTDSDPDLSPDFEPDLDPDPGVTERDGAGSLAESDLPAGPGLTAGAGSIAAPAALGAPPVPAAPTPSATGVTTSARFGPQTASASGMPGIPGLPVLPPPITQANEGGAKTDTKRVTVPAVRNGAPVQGRLTLPAESDLAEISLEKGPESPAAIVRRQRLV